MTAIACALLSALCFYLSIGLGDIWPLAWIAPIPVLWLAFGTTPSWRVFAAAFAAYAIADANCLPAYGGAMPIAVLALAILGPALLFAMAVGGARTVYRGLGPSAGVLTFAVFWAGLDFLVSFNRAGGAMPTPSAAQIDAPLLVQSASLVGFYGVTFLMGAVSAALAAALRTRRPGFALAALCLFGANAAWGAAQLSQPATGTMRVGLIASNDVHGKSHEEDQPAALQAINAYAAQVDALAQSQPHLTVMPENLAMLAPAWRAQAQAPLAAAARRAMTTLVAGFNTRIEGAQRNVSLAFGPSGEPAIYQKRRLVLGLETQFYTPGAAARVLSNGVGLEICKDMDFQQMIRADASANHPLVLAVPAWDFGADGWAHARIALMRSVEDGVPMARAARDGWLTINDSAGRVIARRQVGSGFTTLVGDIPLHGRGGDTLYSRIGDVFGWLCVALAAGLIGLTFFRRRTNPARPQ